MKNFIKNIYTKLSWFIYPIYLPHIIAFLCSENKKAINKDITMMNECHNIKGKRHLMTSLLFHLNNSSYFRKLFYHRIGWKSNVFSWYCPGNRYFIIACDDIGGGMCVDYHPYSTIILAKKIGRNFILRNCTTIGNKTDNDANSIPTIGDDVTLGANVCVIGDITIGNNVYIGAGSIVINDIPDNCIAAGNPAKVIKYIQERVK